MTYAVYVTESFNKEIEKLGSSEKKILEKIFSQLKSNPYVGDPIKYKFFREKRIKEKRIYYLVYDEFYSVLVVAISNKKAQQETIDEIIGYLPEFKEYMKNLIDKSK
jgi:mRNA-degrading endonuclease RelE of RelBE toxin-antitoxin system